MKRLLVISLAVCVLVITASGCSSAHAKTAAGFCQVYHQQEKQYLAKYGKPANSGLGDLGQLIGALSDWVPIFEALDQAAPPDIEPDGTASWTRLSRRSRTWVKRPATRSADSRPA